MPKKADPKLTIEEQQALRSFEERKNEPLIPAGKVSRKFEYDLKTEMGKWRRNAAALPALSDYTSF